MSMSIAQTPSRGTNTVSWIIQGLLCLAYLAAASAKLAGVPMMVQVFAAIGIGQWFRYVTAGVEITGVILLLVPGFAAFGGLLLGATMFCAIFIHLLILHTNPAPPAVLFALDLTVVWLRRGQIAGLAAKFKSV